MTMFDSQLSLRLAMSRRIRALYGQNRTPRVGYPGDWMLSVLPVVVMVLSVFWFMYHYMRNGCLGLAVPGEI